MSFSLATRGSALALWQAGHVQSQLRAAHPGVDVELVVVKTAGDRATDRPLAAIGGTGVFTREVDNAVLHGAARGAVHSLKDLPTEPVLGLVIAAVLERADPRDAFLAVPGLPSTLDGLPPGARVGTSSPRRRSLMLARRPDLAVEELRGNLDTRLARVAHGECDAAILALAGLQRLDRTAAIGELLDPPHWLPAPGQGAIAVVVRADDAGALRMLEPLDHAITRQAVTAERTLLAGLRGGCQVPVGALARVTAGRLAMHAYVGSTDGRTSVRDHAEGAASAPRDIASALLQRLLARGAHDIIAQSRAAASRPPDPSPP